MNEVSLFSGTGGGILGTKLLGFNTIAYVEKDDHCQQVIAQRIKDGIYDEAPIWNDIETFNSYAHYYAGACEVVTAGFPCQPFSVAGKQEGQSDPRNKWPATITAIRQIKPKFVLLENVPGLINHKSGYFGRILWDLAQAGFDARWIVLGADDLGAPHHRKRLWILAYSEHYGSLTSTFPREHGTDVLGTKEGQDSSQQPEGVGSSSHVANTTEHRIQGLWEQGDKITVTHGGAQLPLCCGKASWPAEPPQSGEVWQPVVFGITCDGDTCIACGQDYGTCPCIGPTEMDVRYFEGKDGIMWGKRQAEPCVDRVADGVADRSNRLKAIGNGQVPRVVATAWRLLTGEIR